MDETRYTLHEELPSPERFVELRDAAGMSSRTLDAAEAGLPDSLFGATVDEETGEMVGMGRVVGDGATVFHLCDMAVHPNHQGRGLGSAIMDALMAYVGETAPPSAYVNLLADVDGFYERWGFERTAPATTGMYWTGE